MLIVGKILLLSPQVITLPDTIIARTIPSRNLLDWTNGLLELVVLLLAVGALISFIWLIRVIRTAIDSANATLANLSKEARPLLAQASALVDDARDTVDILREGALQVCDSATAISEELLHVADTTAKRVDDINAVLDVFQSGLERTAISAASAVSGIQAGAAMLAGGMFANRRRKRNRARMKRRRGEFHQERLPIDDAEQAE